VLERQGYIEQVLLLEEQDREDETLMNEKEEDLW
jgi:hypothetical protein